MKRLIFSLLALTLLGAVGCDKVEMEDQYYVLWLTATVVDEQGAPIEGIYAYPEGEEFVGRTGYTDYQGYIGAIAYLTPHYRWVIHFEDRDGEYNRGEYERRTIDITDQVLKPNTPDKWGYTGSSFIEMGTITMKLKDRR